MNVPGLNKIPPEYTEGSAPCCCVEGSTQNPPKNTGIHTEHSLLHSRTKEKFETIMETENLSFDKAKKAAAKAHTEAIKDPQTGQPKCKAECLEAQLQIYFDKVSTKSTSNIQLRQQNGSTGKVYRKGL
jgi:hypothetical protein